MQPALMLEMAHTPSVAYQLMTKMTHRASADDAEAAVYQLTELESAGRRDFEGQLI